MGGIEMNAPWNLLSGWITRERRGGGRWSRYTRWETLSQQSGKACRQRVNVLAIELQLLSTYDMLIKVALAPKGLAYSLVGSQNINNLMLTSDIDIDATMPKEMTGNLWFLVSSVRLDQN